MIYELEICEMSDFKRRIRNNHAKKRRIEKKRILENIEKNKEMVNIIGQELGFAKEFFGIKKKKDE
jgi:hypothetical protein